MEDFKSYLQKNFLDRCKKNPKYSLRAYAKQLKINNSTLSQILRGKRSVTRNIIFKIAEELHMDVKTKERFLEDLLTDKSTRLYKQINVDKFKILSDWFHFAIFELVTLKDFDPRPQAIAAKLNISPIQAKAAVDRLKRVGLLKEVSNEKLIQTDKFITTVGDNITVPAFKFMQKGIMERSLRSLEETSLEKRDHTAMTMAINSKFISEAKIRIKNFRRSLCEDFQAEPNRDSVYQLAISFFPLTQNKEAK